MKKVLLALGIVFSWFWATSSIVYGTDPWSMVSQYIHVNEVKDRVGIHTEFPQTDLHVIWNTMIQWDTAARWKLISDMNDDNADGNFDVWIQWWERWMTWDDRNLALLWYDEDSGDALRINFNNEFENGTQIDGNLWIGTAATTDALTVSGSVRATEYCDENGENCNFSSSFASNFKTYFVLSNSKSCSSIVSDVNALVNDTSGGETPTWSPEFIQDDNGMWQIELVRGDCSPMSNTPGAVITIPVNSNGDPIQWFYINEGLLP